MEIVIIQETYVGCEFDKSTKYLFGQDPNTFDCFWEFKSMFEVRDSGRFDYIFDGKPTEPEMYDCEFDDDDVVEYNDWYEEFGALEKSFQGDDLNEFARLLKHPFFLYRVIKL